MIRTDWSFVCLGLTLLMSVGCEGDAAETRALAERLEAAHWLNPVSDRILEDDFAKLARRDPDRAGRLLAKIVGAEWKVFILGDKTIKESSLPWAIARTGQLLMHDDIPDGARRRAAQAAIRDLNLIIWAVLDLNDPRYAEEVRTRVAGLGRVKGTEIRRHYWGAILQLVALTYNSVHHPTGQKGRAYDEEYVKELKELQWELEGAILRAC